MKKAMVFGAGLSGQGAIDLLKKSNYDIILVDDNSGISSKKAIDFLDDVNLFVKSPGISYNSLVLAAKDKNIPILNEIQLAYDYMKVNNYSTKIIAITGTNGKTTVTTKITELLTYAGFRAKFAGNIGVSLGALILEDKNLDYIVLELSSFQLENLTDFKADIALIVNLTPDHLERYSSLDEYYLTKFNICKNQDKNDIFILNKNSKEIENIVRKYSLQFNSQIFTVSKFSDNSNISVSNDFIRYNDEDVLSCKKVTLKGEHNLENILFIVAVAKLLDLSDENIQDFLYTTDNIEHRMENFYQYKNITFVNDSKGTNIDSSKYAIEAFKNCILICGGHDKKSDWNVLADIITKNNLKEVYLIGEISDLLKKFLLKNDFPAEKIHSLENIEKSLLYIKSHINPYEEQVVLLSPATSSYDQFKNFVERGNIFKDLVKKIFI